MRATVTVTRLVPRDMAGVTKLFFKGQRRASCHDYMHFEHFQFNFGLSRSSMGRVKAFKPACLTC